ncbi:MAG: alpha/beta fold hydrolase [Myxococcota bacterium]
MEPRARHLKGADGLELRLYEWSETGTTLLLLHGFGNDAHVWDSLAPRLAPHYRTLALDLRGHGHSDWDPEQRYDHASMARDVERVLDQLGAGRVVLVGHSLGGRVGMRFAGLAPERMAGFVIVDSGPDLDLRGVSRIREEAATEASHFTSVRQYEELLARNYPATAPATLVELARHWLRERPEGGFEPTMDPALRRGLASAEHGEDARLSLEREAQTLWAALERLPCPALLVRGAASDVLSADVADAMEARIPNARLVVVPRAGHSVMLDNPEAFEAAVLGFVLGED